MASLHITNGDCVARPLRGIVAGAVVSACDVLHEGPAPPVDGDAWREIRARFLGGGATADYETARRQLAESDRMIASATDYDEVVLWFEHDLFDQLNLVRTLTLLTQASRVSLICIGAFPGIERFVGLGQLSRDQLASLFPSRRPVGSGDYAVARQAWDAFRCDDPSGLADVAGHAESDDFLAGAISRFMAEYPSTDNGLPRTENDALRALLSGPLTGRELFSRSQANEPRPFLGDRSLFNMLLDLAGAPVPLVRVAGAPTVAEVLDSTISLTDAGRRVVEGIDDAVRLNGVDRWRGGVHLSGRDARWRWNPARQTLVSWR